ncbi:MAG: hypothetical protein ACREKE_10005, partial [bacterium]
GPMLPVYHVPYPNRYRGTASNLRTNGLFMRTAAGKTGTTSDFADAWFVGYTPKIVAGCWFGYDQRRRIGRLLTGGAIAAPVWADFMNQALAGTPDKPFPVPSGVKFNRICAATGKPPTADCKRVINEAFVTGTDIQPVQEGTPVPNLDVFYESEMKGVSQGATAAPSRLNPPAGVGNGVGGYNANGDQGF